MQPPTLRRRAVISIRMPPGGAMGIRNRAIPGLSLSGTTVTCSGACAAGLAAPNICTVDGTVKSGGTSDRSLRARRFTHSGELDVQHNGTMNVNANATSGSGTLAIAPGSGAVCKLAFVNPGPGRTELEPQRSGGNSGTQLLRSSDLQHGTERRRRLHCRLRSPVARTLASTSTTSR